MQRKADWRRTFAQHVEGLCAAFGKEPDKALVHAYWLGLDDMPPECFLKACKRALRECEFMPKPVELRRLGGELGADARAVNAWTELERSLRVHGVYRSVCFEDAAVNATVRALGGWAFLCGVSSDDLKRFTRPQFLKAYKGFFENGVRGDAGQYLIGAHEAENRAKGYEVPAPLMIASSDRLPDKLLASKMEPVAQVASVVDALRLVEANFVEEDAA